MDSVEELRADTLGYYLNGSDIEAEENKADYEGKRRRYLGEKIQEAVAKVKELHPDYDYDNLGEQFNTK